jgi:hypothetical protein
MIKLFKVLILSIILLVTPCLLFGQTFSLGSASNFCLFTGNGALTNSGISNVTGDIGSEIGAVSGFGAPSILTGTSYNGDAVTAQAKIDLFTAYNQLTSIPVTDASHTPAFGGGETLTAGVYTISGAGSLAGDLILDGSNDTSSVFIFRFGGAYAAGALSSVTLINDARSCNIFWVAEGAISLGEGTIMKGTLLANNAAASAAANCDIEGRLLSTTGAVAFGPAIISIPTCDGEIPLPPVLCCNPDFGETIDFVVFTANGAVSNTGASILTKNIGTDLGLITNFGPATVVGAIHNADAVTALAKTDLFSLYNQLIVAPITNSSHIPAFGSGETLTKGVYSLPAAGSLAGNLTLDAQGDTTAVFIFRIRGAFSVGANSNIILVNLAASCSVFWVVEGAISIGATSVMKGTYISNNDAISMLSNGNLKGRLFSTNGAIAVHTVDVDNTEPCQLPSVALPIDLVSFHSKCINENVTLEWSTASELNNDFFTIERSVDLINWEIISTVSGAGNSSSLTNYSFIDVSQSAEVFYYRLKQTDFNNSFKHSKIIAVKNCEDGLSELSVYPNPASDFINISIRLPEERISSVSIYNLSGEIIYESKTYEPRIVFENKNEGIYLIEIQLSKKSIVKKFVIIN